MKFKFSERFADDMAIAVPKAGQRAMLSEALVELELLLISLGPKHLRPLQVGGSTLLDLKNKGKVKVLRSQNGQVAPRYALRFLGVPHVVLVATCEEVDAFYNLGELRSLSFMAVLCLAQGLAVAAAKGRSLLDGRDPEPEPSRDAP